MEPTSNKPELLGKLLVIWDPIELLQTGTSVLVIKHKVELFDKTLEIYVVDYEGLDAEIVRKL